MSAGGAPASEDSEGVPVGEPEGVLSVDEPGLVGSVATAGSSDGDGEAIVPVGDEHPTSIAMVTALNVPQALREEFIPGTIRAQRSPCRRDRSRFVGA